MRARIANLTAGVLVLVSGLLVSATGAAEDNAQELAKKLSNPVASLISVPFQFNYDSDIGPVDDGDKAYLNFQPVVPVSISTDWNLISRTILPLVTQDDVFPGAGSQTGLGDVLQSLFFSPKAPTSGGLIWGIGPAFLVPTASDELLGSGKWGAGPTGVLLKQNGPWTIGMLANHIWSFAGKSDRSDVSSTFMQPFLSYGTKTGRSYTVNFESTYDWEADELSLPLNVVAAQIIKIGGHPVQFGAGVRYWVDSPDSGPEGFGLRLFATLLFPK